MSPLERVKKFLAQVQLPLEIIMLDEDTSTSALAAQALGVQEGQIAKSLVFTGKEGQGVLVVTSGDMKVDQKKLKKTVGFKPKFASGEEAQALTGFIPGGVCPFALLTPLPVLIDISMERYPIVYAAAGTAYSVVQVDVQGLLEMTGGQLCDVCRCNS